MVHFVLLTRPSLKLFLVKLRNILPVEQLEFRALLFSAYQVTFGIRQDAFFYRFRFTKDFGIETFDTLNELVVLLLLLHI